MCINNAMYAESRILKLLQISALQNIKYVIIRFGV